jgi:hypothetical protein
MDLKRSRIRAFIPRKQSNIDIDRYFVFFDRCALRKSIWGLVVFAGLRVSNRESQAGFSIKLMVENGMSTLDFSFKADKFNADLAVYRIEKYFE